MDPFRLNQFLDKPRTQSAPLGAMRSANSYDQTFSWDGMSVDPRPFSRLDARPLLGALGAHSRGSGIAGTRVIELEPAAPGGSLCFHEHEFRAAPRTEAQIDAAAPADARGAAAVVGTTRFANMGVRAAALQMTDVPVAYQRVVAMDKGGLVTPAQRREALAYEVQHHAAMRLQRRAVGEQRQMEQLMRYRHPDGVLGLDSTANAESGVYGAKAQARLAHEQAHVSHADRRRANIARVTVAAQRLGYDPYAHDETRQAPRPFMQRVGRAGASRSEDTHANIFYQPEGRDNASRNAQRREHLRESNARGKNYDIVNHTLAQ